MHTSDLHLGDDCEPELAKRGFVAVVDRATVEDVDLLIIAGDLFDSRLAAWENLDFVLEHLGRLSMPIVLLPGNHDPCDDGSIYRSIDIGQRYPNVYLISDPAGQLLHFPELRLRLWGRPVVEHSPTFRPLGDIPERTGDHWHVAVAHGLHVEDERRFYLSSLIPERDVIAAGWDYLALGHVHPYRDVSRPGAIACYSGSPARLQACGVEAGNVALVELDSSEGVRVRPLPIEL